MKSYLIRRQAKSSLLLAQAKEKRCEMKKKLIQGKDLCKKFAQNSNQVCVLDNASIDVYEGDFSVVMSASGAGKSTLLYALSGMDKITSGSVEYKDRKISGLSEKKMAELRAREFGFVFQ